MQLFQQLVKVLAIAVAVVFLHSSGACAAPDAWVGNMIPEGYSSNTIAKGESFTIYVQVYRQGYTDAPGRGGDIECTLYWGEVDRFGGSWKEVISTPMTYRGDIGNNDEYRADISPGTGLYEFTASCGSPELSATRWQNEGNGRLTVSPFPSISDDRRALWVESKFVAWNQQDGSTYELHYAKDGDLLVPVRAGLGVPLTLDRRLTIHSYEKFPNINGYDAWRVPDDALAQLTEILRSEIAIAAYDAEGKLLDATGVQLQGVLDDRYGYEGDLGVIYTDGIPTLKLWAPTAQQVSLYRHADPDPNTPPIVSPMDFDPETGVWSITGDADWDRQYYEYEVQVYVPYTGEIEYNYVTDPWAANLSQNSRLSQIVDLDNDPSLKPDGWDDLVKPPYTVPEDMAIYEVHVRDFSHSDESVPEVHRGTFLAFTHDGESAPLSDGMAHLQQLAAAGLTHIHLLPAFDFASVEENPKARVDPAPVILQNFGRNSVQQQAIIGAVRGADSFNWGYDPYHYGVPEGSYATDANGTARIREFREMVKTLSDNGLRVALDVVYNHTFANGLYTQAVLDKVVPAYYHRYNNNGYQQNSSCCADTAMEFDMAQKLMVDTVIRWARAYKIDSFRFDLMNLLPASSMIDLRDRLGELTAERDGVDGREIYLYGEGWDFGSARAKGLYHANQYNTSGTGIGTYNDKIRDAIHGGYSGDALDIRKQGFINGQAYDWNGFFYSSRFRNNLRTTTDKLRVGLAGSLRNFKFVDQNGNRIRGIDLEGVGYTRDPQETVNYMSKHDNETLYDLNMFKLPYGEGGMSVTSMEERVRAQNMGLSLIALAQGVPFFHMGSDMLRSKSLDHNSYDSGDWFNRVDFSYEDNTFASGLPPAWNNQGRWSIMSPLLANPNLKPERGHILDTVEHMREMLQIRRSSKLFRLETEGEVEARVRFHNTGTQQKDGLIVMSIDDTVGADLDSERDRIVVLFNANKFGQTLTIPELRGEAMELHEVLANSHDPLVKKSRFDSDTGTFEVPGRTTAVFVARAS